MQLEDGATIFRNNKGKIQRKSLMILRKSQLSLYLNAEKQLRRVMLIDGMSRVEVGCRGAKSQKVPIESMAQWQSTAREGREFFLGIDFERCTSLGARAQPSTMLDKNAVFAFQRCLMVPDKICIFKKTYDNFALNFAGELYKIANKIN